MHTSFAQQKHMDSLQRYTKVPVGYLMVLRQGDSILTEIERFARKEKIPSANFSGMGFVHVKFGFFNAATKQYMPKEFKDVELASMLGTVAWQEEKISIHAHGVVGDKDFHAYAGHILSATVSTGSVEILITLHDKKLERITDPDIGANILSLED